MARRLFLAVPLALPVAVATGFAQAASPSAALPPPRADYALTNVRIVTAPGRVIERGTVLTRNGRIAAVGAQVAIPAGVVQMDLNGHTVYPGLIDAATSIGLPSPNRPPAETPAAAAAPPGGGRGGGGRGAGGAGGRGAAAPPPPVVEPAIDAAAEAADMFAPTDDQLKAFRAGGVTTVGLVFQGGIFPGRVGAALTGSPDVSPLALRTAAGQTVSFGTRGRGNYPGTGIGSVAYIKQSFLDAQYEARLEKAFKAGTPGARPSNDPYRRALMPAAGSEIASWFVASTERELTRVSEIAREIGLKGPVIVGAQEGWRAVSAIKQAGATAVVSVRWQAPELVTGRSFLAVGSGKSGTAPDVTAADSAEVRANPAALAKAGVTVALASFGGESGTAFRNGIRQAIAAGMSADDALRAATVTPAALLGVSAAVGTIEVGKLANLVVVTGNDLFASGNPIKHVFIEGRIY